LLYRSGVAFLDTRSNVQKRPPIPDAGLKRPRSFRLLTGSASPSSAHAPVRRCTPLWRMRFRRAEARQRVDALCISFRDPKSGRPGGIGVASPNCGEMPPITSIPAISRECADAMSRGQASPERVGWRDGAGFRQRVGKVQRSRCSHRISGSDWAPARMVRTRAGSSPITAFASSQRMCGCLVGSPSRRCFQARRRPTNTPATCAARLGIDCSRWHEYDTGRQCRRGELTKRPFIRTCTANRPISDGLNPRDTPKCAPTRAI
jgi:hypothetical protein